MSEPVTRLDTQKANVLAALRNGAIMREAAEAAGVSRAAVYNWRKDDAEFDRAVRAAQEFGVRVGEDVLAECATQLVLKDPRYQTSLIFFLKNRGGKRWHDVQEFHHAGGIDVRTVGDEAIHRMCAALLAKWGDVAEDDDGGNGNGAAGGDAEASAPERDPPEQPADADG